MHQVVVAGRTGCAVAGKRSIFSPLLPPFIRPPPPPPPRPPPPWVVRANDVRWMDVPVAAWPFIFFSFFPSHLPSSSIFGFCLFGRSVFLWFSSLNAWMRSSAPSSSSSSSSSSFSFFLFSFSVRFFAGAFCVRVSGRRGPEFSSMEHRNLLLLLLIFLFFPFFSLRLFLVFLFSTPPSPPLLLLLIFLLLLLFVDILFFASSFVLDVSINRFLFVFFCVIVCRCLCALFLELVFTEFTEFRMAIFFNEGICFLFSSPSGTRSVLSCWAASSIPWTWKGWSKKKLRKKENTVRKRRRKRLRLARWTDPIERNAECERRTPGSCNWNPSKKKTFKKPKRR